MKNHLHLDPTRTGTLRNAFEKDLVRRYRTGVAQVAAVVRAARTDAGRGLLQGGLNTGMLQDWIGQVFRTSVLEPKAHVKYLARGWLSGNTRSAADVDRLRRDRPMRMFAEPVRIPVSNVLLTFNADPSPLTLEAIEIISGRVYTSLTGITSAMSANIVEALVAGLLAGESVETIAAAIVSSIPTMSLNRARTLAHTEIISAYAEGQLDLLEDAGVESLGVMVEWSTARDGRVCPLCGPMNGRTFSLADARGRIPMHPRCRCAWIPAGVGEFTLPSVVRTIQDAPPNSVIAASYVDPVLLRFSQSLRSLGVRQ